MMTTPRNDPGANSGDVRAGILALLAESPLSGYELINEVTERSNGHWRATSATIYPMLEQLDSEGLVQLSEAGGGGNRQRPFELTRAGRLYVDENATELTPPWEAASAAPSSEETVEEAQPSQIEIQAPAAQSQESGGQAEEAGEAVARFRGAATQFSTAVDQVAQVGTEQQLERARQHVAESKRGLYRILAEEENGQ